MVPLKEVLEEHFGSGFPVGAGSTKRDDPLVITDQRDYVAIEHAVARFLLEQMGFEYKLEKQGLHEYESRAVDELVYAAKEIGESEWTQTRRFFFDITAGFYSDRSSLPIERYTLAISTTGEGRKPTSEVLRDELLAFASNTFRDGGVPKSYLTVVKSDGSQFVFQIGLLDLVGSQRLDFIRYLLFVEKAVAYAQSFRVGVKVGGDAGVVERLAVYGADVSSYAAGELTIDRKDEEGVGVKILEPTTTSPTYEFQKLLDGAFVRKKSSAWQRLTGTGKDESEWSDEWNRLCTKLHWLRAAG
jgi:hypothetical protein